jgi:hypothetical protein
VSLQVLGVEKAGLAPGAFVVTLAVLVALVNAREKVSECVLLNVED